MSANCLLITFNHLKILIRVNNETIELYKAHRVRSDGLQFVSNSAIAMLSTLFIGLLVGLVAGDSKYCDTNLCPNNLQHIACGNSGAFYPTCPPDRQLVDLSDSDIQLFLDNHNKYRHRIANGDVVGFFPAERMATMVKV